MKKLINKVNNNKILFSLFIIFIFIMFDFITTGFGLSEIWIGMTNYLVRIFMILYEKTYYGIQVFHEFIWFLFLIPVILIFKNKYIFTQKRDGFFKSLMLAWPIILYSIILLIESFKSVEISKISMYELFALIILCFLIGLFEEILFRGWIQNEFIERFGKNRKGVIFTIIVSSIIFGLAHSTNAFYGQSLLITITQVFTVMVSGISLGAIYYKTKNIWAVIILHAFWDFAIFFGDVNVASTCVTIEETATKMLPVYVVSSLLFAIIASFPEIGTALLVLNKKNINERLSEENKINLTNEDSKKSKTFKIVMSIILVLYLSLIGFLLLSNNKEESKSCPKYISKEVENYSEHYLYSDYYEINYDSITQLETKTYNFSIEKNKKGRVVIKNKNTEYFIKLEYDNVRRAMIIENDDKYIIIVANETESQDIAIYSSDYITKTNLSDEHAYLDGLSKSFKQVMLPSIKRMGYYQEEGNYHKYPLFENGVKEKYILDETGKIFVYDTLK